MTIEHLLAGKSRDVVTIEPNQSISEAVKLLAERRIGAIVVSDANRSVLGILSERDIVRAAAAGGAASLQDPVSRHMTSRVVTATVKMSINEVMERMTDGKFRHIPVVDGGRLTGIVSIGDVVKHRLAEMEAESEALRGYIASA
jgi:CBS domain-containing protein